MPHRETTKPFVFFFLVLPYGISSGFVSITLPFVLTRAGFSVATAASIVAIGVSANLWRFFVGPVADLTLTARRWYLIGLSAAALTLFLLGLFPLNTNTTAMLVAIVFCFTSCFHVHRVAGRWHFLAAPLTLRFPQWSYLRLDAVPRRRNTQRFRRSATCRSFTRPRWMAGCMIASAQAGCCKPMPFQRSYLWSSPSLSCRRSMPRGLRVSRRPTAAPARTARTPQQLVLAV
jgi:hypothetical protein